MKKNNVSYDKLRKDLNIPWSTIAAWQKKKSYPQKKWRIEIAKYLNIPLDNDNFDNITALFLENRKYLDCHDIKKINDIIIQRIEKVKNKNN